MNQALRRARCGATLAEAVFGTVIFALFALGVLGTLGQSAHLNVRDKEVNQVNSLTQGYLEQLVMQAKTKAGYFKLAPMALRSADDPYYLYAVDIAHTMPGTTRIAVLLYYHDPVTPATTIDVRRPNGGMALCLSTLVEEP